MFSWRKKRYRPIKKRKRKKEKTPKLILIRQIVVGVGCVLLVVALGAGVWYGSRIQSLTLSEVRVIGSQSLDEDYIRSLVDEQLEGSYYHLVPKRFAWLYPRDTIMESVGTVKRIDQVTVERDGGTELVVAFSEYQPYALWCEAVDTKECVYLDRSGYAYEAAPALEGGAFLRFSKRGAVPEEGVQIFSKEFVQDSVAFGEQVFTELGFYIRHIEQTADEEVSFYVASGGEIKTSIALSYEDTLENLITVLRSEEFNHLEPGNFKYIDLRYGNKIFVNEVVDESEAAAASSSTATGSPVTTEEAILY